LAIALRDAVMARLIALGLSTYRLVRVLLREARA